MTKRPNIVLIQCDDRRASTIHCLGADQIHTPHTDALVARGTVFTHACNPGGTSGAICMPSRAMLNTGRTLFHIHGSGEMIPEAHTTLGEAFRAAGYATYCSGKWHSDTASFNRSFSDGGDIFFGGMNDHWNTPLYDYDPSGVYRDHLPFIRDPAKSNLVERRNGDHLYAGKHSTDIIADAGERFIAKHPKDEPYFLYLPFIAPHDPRTTHKEFHDMYDPSEIDLPPNFLGGHPFENGDLNIRDEVLARFPRRPDEIKQHIAEYYAILTHFDSRIGTIVQAVKDRGDFDNTIFVDCADHGLALGQHGLMGKQNLYDHSIRVPLIFAGPGIPSGALGDDMVYLMDIFPTLCGLAGVNVPETVEGKSLINKGSIQAGRDALYLAYMQFQRGVRTDRWKLIEYVTDGRHSMTQLFDLENDPWEMCNLAEDKAHQSTLRTLRQQMLKLSYEWDDRTAPLGQTFWEGWAESAGMA